MAYSLVWVLLAPAPAAQLEERAAALRRDRLGAGEKYLPKWEVQNCQGQYSAVFSRNPGSERTLEVPFAELLSSELALPVYVLYLDKAYGGLEVIEVYERGQHKENLAGDPYGFARKLGCPLPGEPKPAKPEGTIKSAIVVAGASADDAARALKIDRSKQQSPIRLTDGPTGVVLYRPTGGDLTMTAYRLSEAFPRRDVYKLNTGPLPGRFSAWVVRDGQNAGLFEYPVTPGPGDGLTPRLDAVSGKKTPAEIADALGVPREALGL
ncbi:hypothetical protein V1279_007586 [Bradyrhizobium sp. AZCC 1610]|uniref:hypothetical protein n=1 Tax=Bradyrhizobium sp. AZCC 1610 TaxID=3117020 RepID=UPI002FF1C016